MEPAVDYRRRRLVAVLLLLVAGIGVGTYLALRSEQAEVGAGVLPLVPGGRAVLTFVDCSKVNSLAYFAHNPCETFVLVRGQHFRSATGLLSAEAATLRAAGWRHPGIEPPIDYDVGDAMAPLQDSWYSPDGRACAYIATDHAAVAAEGRELIPFDRYDNPAGMLSFYRAADSAQGGQNLWVRLRPPVMLQPAACGPARP